MLFSLISVGQKTLAPKTMDLDVTQRNRDDSSDRDLDGQRDSGKAKIKTSSHVKEIISRTERVLLWTATRVAGAYSMD